MKAPGGWQVRGPWAVLALAAVVASAGRSAFGQVADAPIRIRYDAPPPCPGQEVLIARLEARTKRYRVAAPDENASTFLVTIQLREGESGGHLVIRGTDGVESDRDVAGATCEEVVDALALVMALAIDPEAVTSAPAPSATQAAPAASSARAPTRARSPRAVPRAGDSAPQRWRFDSGGGIDLVAGVPPDPMVAARLFVDASRSGPESWQPAVRLTGRFGASGQVEASGGDGTASFRWLVASLEGCPLWSRGPIGLSPCVLLEAGSLHASARGIVLANEEGDDRAWAAAGIIGRGRWLPFRWAVVEIDGGLRAPLTRDRFFFRDDRTIHQVPAAAWTAGADVGVRFP